MPIPMPACDGASTTMKSKRWLSAGSTSSTLLAIRERDHADAFVFEVRDVYSVRSARHLHPRGLAPARDELGEMPLHVVVGRVGADEAHGSIGRGARDPQGDGDRDAAFGRVRGESW